MGAACKAVIVTEWNGSLYGLLFAWIGSGIYMPSCGVDLAIQPQWKWQSEWWTLSCQIERMHKSSPNKWCFLWKWDRIRQNECVANRPQMQMKRSYLQSCFVSGTLKMQWISTSSTRLQKVKHTNTNVPQ